MQWLRVCLLVGAVLTACSGPTAPPTAPAVTPTRAATLPARPASPSPPTAPPLFSRETSTPAPTATEAAVSWPVFNGDASRAGVNRREQRLRAATLGRLDVLWSRSLPDVADSTPVDQDGRLFFTLRNGTAVALEAQIGTVLWSATTKGPRITNSSPALDPSGQIVYSYGLDGFVHRYDVASGRELTGSDWPVRVTWLTEVEKESSALNLANGRLYATTSGYRGDRGHYDGHLVVIDLARGSATVFNSLCSGIRSLLVDRPGAANYCPEVQSGIWARAGAVVEPGTGNVFLATGNGPWNGATNWGDSVLELTGDGQQLLDSYTPANQAQLDEEDVDLGSTAPALLPPQPASTTPFLAVQGGKDGFLRLLNRRGLSGRGRLGQFGGELQLIAAPGRCPVLTAPVVWTAPDGSSWIFVADSCGLGGYRLVTDSTGQSRLGSQWQVSGGGTSPLIAADVLYLARSGAVEARDPVSGHLLWTSQQLGPRGTIGRIHWESPVVVDGRLIIADERGIVTAFGLP